MRILIVDRDPLASQLLLSRLEASGHTVVVEPVRKTALERLNTEAYDVILIDPAPLPSVRQFTLPLRWEQRQGYFYLIQLGHEVDPDEVVRSGLNDWLPKPFDWQLLSQKLHNAAQLNQLMHFLRDSDDVHSDTNIFGKRAFYQLMLSVLDRTYRYGEQAFLMMIRILNAKEVEAKLSPEQQQVMRTSLETYLSKLHRLSDYLGHIHATEYGLLFLRPAADTEPMDAAERFAIALEDWRDQQDTLPVVPEFLISLWELPSANCIKETQLAG